MSIAISVAALVITLGLWWWERHDRLRDARIQDEQRRRDRQDVHVDVKLVEQSGDLQQGRKLSNYWWRVSMTGGTAYSRATVTRMVCRNDSTYGDVLAGRGGPIELSAGQQVHLPTFPPSMDDAAPTIEVEWTVEDEVRSRVITVRPEPWT